LLGRAHLLWIGSVSGQSSEQDATGQERGRQCRTGAKRFIGDTAHVLIRLLIEVRRGMAAHNRNPDAAPNLPAPQLVIRSGFDKWRRTAFPWCTRQHAPAFQDGRRKGLKHKQTEETKVLGSYIYVPIKNEAIRRDNQGI
jgi:hypothetical protein